jgi:hypothetical protein
MPGWRGWICVALIGLILYNPFAALCGANDGFCYDRLARNRASVGASELQHFSPVSNSVTQTEPDLDVPATDLLQVVQEESQTTDLQEVFPPQTELVAQLWNKPPPLLSK